MFTAIHVVPAMAVPGPHRVFAIVTGTNTAILDFPPFGRLDCSVSRYIYLDIRYLRISWFSMAPFFFLSTFFVDYLFPLIFRILWMLIDLNVSLCFDD